MFQGAYRLWINALILEWISTPYWKVITGRARANAAISESLYLHDDNLGSIFSWIQFFS